MDTPTVSPPTDAYLPRGARRRGSRALLVAAAALLFVACSVVSIFQPSRLPPHVAAQSRAEWFFYPVETNPPLQSVDSDLYGVYALDERRIWAVGNRGAIVHTEDGGRTWIRQPTPSAQTVVATTNTNAPVVTNTNTSANTNVNSRALSAATTDGNSSNGNARNANGNAASGGSSRRRGAARNGNGKRAVNRNTNSGNRNTFGVNPNRDFAHSRAPLAGDGHGESETTRGREPLRSSSSDSKPAPGLRLSEAAGQNANMQNENISSMSTPTTARKHRKSKKVPATPTPTPRRTHTTTPPTSQTNQVGNTNTAGNTNAANNNSSGAANNANSNSTSRTTPGGTIQEDLVAVTFMDAERGWAAGKDGKTLFATTDGGNTWRPADGATFAPFRGWKSECFIVRTKAYVPDPTGGHARAVPALYQLTNYGALSGNITIGMEGVDLDWVADMNCSSDLRIRSSIMVGQQGEIRVVGNGNLILARRVPSGTNANLWAVTAVGAQPEQDWVVGDGGTILHSADGGQTWEPQKSGTQARLNGVNFIDALHGFAVGDDGLVLGTADGGASWVRLMGKDAPAGSYSRSFAPWYYASLLLVALLIAPAVWPRKEDAPEPEVSVADVLVSDRPLEAGDPDPLQFRQVALGLSRFLRNENTQPPLTIAVTGEWGTGKSSLMNLLRADLRSYGFRPVWFNAWHHQKEEHMLAALLQNVRLQAIPRWWRPVGLRFRWQLLVLRGWRRWLPVLVLLFVAAALFGYAISRFEAGVAVPDDPIQLIVSYVKTTLGASPQAAGSAKTTPTLALLLSVGSLLAATWKGVTAFGANPASLLASVSNSMKLRDLDAQTSFRKKFADEFSDVTRALGARSMIVFIDDLDRCRPENVLETLEAVNFLVSSGGCFVVLGMARERVERCVGLSFKDVAEEVLGDAPMADAQPPSPPEFARRRRAEFARQYLDKLVNIEVPVPTPDAAQSRELLVGAGARAGSSSRLALEWSRAKSFSRAALPVALAALVLAAGAFAGLKLQERLHPGAPGGQVVAANANADHPSNSNTGAPSNSKVNAPVNAGEEVLASTNRNASGSTKRDRALPGAETDDDANATANDNTNAATPDEHALRRQGQTAALKAAAAERPSPFSYLPLALVAALVCTVAGWLVTRRPDLVVKDSEEFKEALRIWHPLLFTRLKTPRAVKRFMNRVRYLAMRQRTPRASRSLWERARLAVWRRLRLAPPESTDAPPATHIPEHLLVALSAVQQIDPNLIKFTKRFSFVSFPPNNLPPGVNQDILTLLAEAEAAHARQFKQWLTELPDEQRAAFLKMSADIRVN